MDALALASMSREREASALLWTRKDIFHVMPEAMQSLHAYLEKDLSRCIAAIEQAEQSKRVDPELRYYLARQAARIGAVDLANKTLLRSVEEGYCCMTALRQDPWLELLRATTQFAQVFELVRTRETQSRRAFVEAGGASVLYVPEAGEAPS
jgi:hypothetical protein